MSSLGPIYLLPLAQPSFLPPWERTGSRENETGIRGHFELRREGWGRWVQEDLFPPSQGGAKGTEGPELPLSLRLRVSCQHRP